MKHFLAILAVFVLLMSSLSGQQFFKTGVVDLNRIYTQFYKDSKAVRDFEDFKQGIQNEINKMKDDIKASNDQRNDAKAKGDTAKVQVLDAEIQKKQNAMLEYARVQQLQINAKNVELQADGSFQKLVSAEIEQSAISKGFGLIINLKDTSIVWYGPDTDITDDVVSRLQADLSR